MHTRYYPAIIDRDAGGGFWVTFPDLPGCTSAGDTIEEAMANAEEALAGHIELELERAATLPEPSDLTAIGPDEDGSEVARVLVRADMPGAARVLSISLPEGLVARIDRKAELMGYSRSAFLAEGARRMLAAEVPGRKGKPRRARA